MTSNVTLEDVLEDFRALEDLEKKLPDHLKGLVAYPSRPDKNTEAPELRQIKKKLEARGRAVGGLLQYAQSEEKLAAHEAEQKEKDRQRRQRELLGVGEKDRRESTEDSTDQRDSLPDSNKQSEQVSEPKTRPVDRASAGGTSTPESPSLANSKNKDTGKKIRIIATAVVLILLLVAIGVGLYVFWPSAGDQKADAKEEGSAKTTETEEIREVDIFVPAVDEEEVDTVHENSIEILRNAYK